MNKRSRVRRLHRIYNKRQEGRQLQDSFLGHLDNIVGRAEEDPSETQWFRGEGAFFHIERTEGTEDAPDLSE